MPENLRPTHDTAVVSLSGTTPATVVAGVPNRRIVPVFLKGNSDGVAKLTIKSNNTPIFGPVRLAADGYGVDFSEPGGLCATAPGEPLVLVLDTGGIGFGGGIGYRFAE